MRNITDLQLDQSATPPSLKNIKHFEEHFGVILPPEYVFFLYQANGGVPRGVSHYDYLTSVGESGNGGVGSFYPFTPGTEEEDGGVWDSTQFLRDIFLDAGLSTDIVAIGEDGGANQLFLSMGVKPATVHVFFRTSNNSTPKIANSFEEFIDNLYVFVDPDSYTS